MPPMTEGDRPPFPLLLRSGEWVGVRRKAGGRSMKTWISLAAVMATVLLAGPARADDGCNCGGGYGYESRSFLRRCCDRVKSKYHDDPSRTCVQGKTHH